MVLSLLKEHIKQEFGTEITDKDKFSKRQLEVIREIMSHIPKNLYCLHKIFAKGVQGYEQKPFWICIPAPKVGQPDKQFPKDFAQKATQTHLCSLINLPHFRDGKRSIKLLCLFEVEQNR